MTVQEIEADIRENVRMFMFLRGFNAASLARKLDMSYSKVQSRTKENAADRNAATWTPGELALVADALRVPTAVIYMSPEDAWAWATVSGGIKHPFREGDGPITQEDYLAPDLALSPM